MVQLIERPGAVKPWVYGYLVMKPEGSTVKDIASILNLGRKQVQNVLTRGMTLNEVARTGQGKYYLTVEVEGEVPSARSIPASTLGSKEVNAFDIGENIINLINSLREEVKFLKEYTEDCEQLMKDNRVLRERNAELTETINKMKGKTLSL